MASLDLRDTIMKFHLNVTPFTKQEAGFIPASYLIAATAFDCFISVSEYVF